MPKYIEAKSEKKKDDLTKKPQAICIHCGSMKSLSKFASNRDWSETNGRDVWCLDCVKKLATKEDMRRYFWQNNREWNEKIWQQAKERALLMISDNPTYNKSGEQRKAAMLDKMTVTMVPTYMNIPGMYKYVDNSENDMTFEQAKAKKIVPEDIDPFAKSYSAEWDGSFTKKELDYLNGYYTRLQKDFSFNDASTIDYAKKVCRASMQVDKVMDDFANGRCDYAAVKDAVNVFDMLSKSANLAACKRKEGQGGGISTWSETTLYLETHGYPMTEEVEWPEDVVDRVNSNYRHLIASLGLDQA